MRKILSCLRGRQRVYRLDAGRLPEVAGGWLARFELPSAADAAGCDQEAAGRPATAPGARPPG